MSISIGTSLPVVGKRVDIDLASPSERQTDQACAAQDGATETISAGMKPERGTLEHLLAQPSPLARFE